MWRNLRDEMKREENGKKEQHRQKNKMAKRTRDVILIPASPKAKAGLGAQSHRPSVRPSQNLVIATPLKLLIQLS